MNKQPTKNFVVFNKSESFIASVAKDFFSAATVFFCVYVSRDSAWWTFITGFLFIVFLFSKIKQVFDTRMLCFDSKKELQAWVDTLE